MVILEYRDEPCTTCGRDVALMRDDLPPAPPRPGSRVARARRSPALLRHVDRPIRLTGPDRVDGECTWPLDE